MSNATGAAGGGGRRAAPLRVWVFPEQHSLNLTLCNIRVICRGQTHNRVLPSSRLNEEVVEIKLTNDIIYIKMMQSFLAAGDRAHHETEPYLIFLSAVRELF